MTAAAVLLIAFGAILIWCGIEDRKDYRRRQWLRRIEDYHRQGRQGEL